MCPNSTVMGDATASFFPADDEALMREIWRECGLIKINDKITKATVALQQTVAPLLSSLMFSG